MVGSGELVTNGTFDVDASGWITDGTTLFTRNASGHGYLDRNGGAGYGVYQDFPTIVGERYHLSFKAVSFSDGVGAKVNLTEFVSSAGSGGSDTTVTGEFTAVSEITRVSLGAIYDAGATASFDNVSIRRADHDRSVKNNGLIVNGAITRVPVATGAELAAYSGFDANSYFEQTYYNSNLDFGTGDFCYMGWTKADIGDRPIFHRTTGSDGGGTLIRTSSGSLEVFAHNGNGYVVFANVPCPTDTWAHFAFLRESGVGKVYVNGELGFSAPLLKDLDFPDAILRVGRRADNTARADRLALLRVGATAPNSAQVAKIYRDELPMFQPNSKVTLHGNSDAVTALTYDEITGLLHAGTGEGRSDFSGLVRVGQTDTPITTKIVAHDGMILEQ